MQSSRGWSRESTGDWEKDPAGGWTVPGPDDGTAQKSRRFAEGRPYSGHYELMEDYVTEHYGSDSVKLSASGENDILEVTITHEDSTVHLTIKPDENGRLVVHEITD